jgi:hypothetical protein
MMHAILDVVISQQHNAAHWNGNNGFARLEQLYSMYYTVSALNG